MPISQPFGCVVECELCWLDHYFPRKPRNQPAASSGVTVHLQRSERQRQSYKNREKTLAAIFAFCLSLHDLIREFRAIDLTPERFAWLPLILQLESVAKTARGSRARGIF